MGLFTRAERDEWGLTEAESEKHRRDCIEIAETSPTEILREQAAVWKKFGAEADARNNRKDVRVAMIGITIFMSEFEARMHGLKHQRPISG